MARLAMVAGALCFIVVADMVRGGATLRIDDQLIGLRNPADPADPIGPAWLEDTVPRPDIAGQCGRTQPDDRGGGRIPADPPRVSRDGVPLARHAGRPGAEPRLEDHFARPRPELVPHLSAVYTSSFPSGHSMLSAVVYLTLGALLARLVKGPALKVYVLVGGDALDPPGRVSRVYMGVHYPTDVLAGWSVGLSWAILCWLVHASSARAWSSARQSDRQSSTTAQLQWRRRSERRLVCDP